MVILLVAAAVAAAFLPLTPLKSGVESRLSDMLGRRVTIDSLHLSLTNGPCFAITGMTAQENHAFGDGVFLSADDVRAGFDVIELMRARRIVLRSLTIKAPQIQLVKSGEGLWNWTTLGGQSAERSEASTIALRAANNLSIAPILISTGLAVAKLKEIRIENASVKLIDRGRPGAQETLYKNITLNASLAPSSAEGSGGGTDVKGEFAARSEEDGETEPFKATLPFDLRIEGQGPSALTVSGSVGAGPFETRNLSVESFTIDGRIASTTGGPLTGNGRISATKMFLPTINLSQKVAEALRITQIGDMEPGSGVASLETAFQISRDTISTTGLRLQQVDGLGDATAQTGSFKIEAALTVNYAATITLSADATSRVKSASTILGMLTSIFETNSRLSVPVNINGDVRHPQIQVDVMRIF
jgi:uncharacterized protein involved in outer membrane biogenesis